MLSFNAFNVLSNISSATRVNFFFLPSVYSSKVKTAKLLDKKLVKLYNNTLISAILGSIWSAFITLFHSRSIPFLVVSLTDTSYADSS